MSDASIPRDAPESLCVDTGDVGEPGVELRVLPDSGFLNLRANPGRQESMDAIGNVLGHALPMEPNTLSGDGTTCYWLGPDEWLVVGAREKTASLLDELESVNAAVNDLSGGYLRLQMQGADVRNLLARGTTLDLHPREFPPGRCAQTGLAKAAVLLGHLDDSGRIELIVRRSFADYLYRWLLQVAHPFGLRVHAD